MKAGVEIGPELATMTSVISELKGRRDMENQCIMNKNSKYTPPFIKRYPS